MKKYFYYLFALSALVMFTSCLSDKDEPERKLSFTTPINCQAINDNDVVFTLGTSKVDMDFAQSLINFTGQVTHSGNASDEVDRRQQHGLSVHRSWTRQR